MLGEFLEWWDEHWCNIAMIVLTAIVIATITVALGSAIENEANRIDSGVIVDKHMDAGRAYSSYSFTIRGEKGGEIVEYTFEVTAKEYAAYKIGDQYHR